MSTNYPAPKRVLVAGGSYAGLAAALNLLDLCEGRGSRFNPTAERDSTLKYRVPVEITIVDERDGYYHLIGSPLALASEEYASKAWIKFSDIAALQHPAIKIIQGSIQSLDSESLSATISEHGTQNQRTLQYDYFVAATGLRRPWPVVPQSLTRETYLAETQHNISATKSSTSGVVIIGGGAVGVEMAAEFKLIHPTISVTLIHSRSQLLSAEPLPDTFKDAVAPLVREAGVDLMLNQRVVSVTPDPASPSTQLLTLSDNTTIRASHILRAISQPVPTTSYLPETCLDADAYVKIAPTTHFATDALSHNARRHFAVGDIAAWSGIKRCGAAMHMGHYAAINIHQELIVDINAAAVGYKPIYASLTAHPPVIGLAVGRKAVCYGQQDGVKQGEDMLEIMFGDDLGWGICWRYLRLGEKTPEAVEDVAAAAAVVGELQGLRLGEKEALKENVQVVVASAA